MRQVVAALGEQRVGAVNRIRTGTTKAFFSRLIGEGNFSRVSSVLTRLKWAALCQLSYNGIEAARETRGRKMPVKPWEEAFWGDSSRRLRGKRLIAFGDSAYTNFSTMAVLVGYLQYEGALQKIRAVFVRFVQHCRNCPKSLPDRCCPT